MEAHQRGIPQHIAIVMDGNGRWAAGRGLPRLAGHDAGMQALKEIVKRSSVLGVKHLTVYAFSTENWKRSAEEVSGIFKIMIQYIRRELEELHENNVRIHILGDYRKLPAFAAAELAESLQVTKDNDGLQFHIALNYGGRDEIVRAARQVALEVKEGSLKPEDITDQTIQDRLYTAGVPDPDLVIRTSGEMRLSNFLLWQNAYSEFYFTDVLWPDFTPQRLEEAIDDYQRRDRRFGGR